MKRGDLLFWTKPEGKEIKGGPTGNIWWCVDREEINEVKDKNLVWTYSTAQRKGIFHILMYWVNSDYIHHITPINSLELSLKQGHAS